MIRNAWPLLLMLWLMIWLGSASPAVEPDDLTFRPTLRVRQGNAAGTGTVIASVPGETLVLTAAHVAKTDGGTPVVEVHRYNLGLERSRVAEGWPVRLPAEVVAVDSAGDVAVLRVVGKEAMPFVARLAIPGEGVPTGSVVTSVGIDGGDRLSSWAARIEENCWFVMEPVGPGNSRGGRELAESAGGREDGADWPDPTGPERPFLLTTRAPVQGRSGGGLFDVNYDLIGVCVGRMELKKGGGPGVFASGESVRRLLREHDLEAALARSDAFQQARQTDKRGPASVVKPEAGHHNTERARTEPSAPSRTDRVQDGRPAQGRP